MMKKYLALPIAIMASNLALAQGYYVDEQSAKRLGDAFSGGAAEAQDASTAFYNPAGLARLTKDELIVNVSGVIANTKVNDATLTPAITGEEIDQDTNSVIPSLYFAKRADDISTLAFYINAPYATGVDFGEDSKARYQSSDSNTTGINLGMMVGVQITPELSLGGGLVFQYLQATVEKSVNVSAVCAQELGTTCASALSLSYATDTSTDASFSMKGNSFATGVNLGALYQYSDEGRVGLSYRSKIEHELEGDAKFDVSGLNAASKGFADSAGLTQTKADGSAMMTTPETISLSVFQGLGDFAVQADVTYTSWSDFDQLAIKSDNALIKKLAGEPELYNWDDNIRFALGGSYQVTDSLILRTGVAMDESPIPDETTKVDLALGDYQAISLGASYQIGADLGVDLAVQQTFVGKRDIKQAGAGAELSGEIENTVTSVAVGMNWKY